MKIDARSAIVGALLVAVVGVTIAWQTPIATIQSADRVLQKLGERDMLIALRGDNVVAGPAILEDATPNVVKTLAHNSTGATTNLWLTTINLGDEAVRFILSDGTSLGLVEPGRSRSVAATMDSSITAIAYEGLSGTGELRFAWVLKEASDF